jgi:hypothetical protein
MHFSEPVLVIAITTGALVILLLLMILVLYRKRNNIIRMNRLVNGKVIDIQERRGMKGNQYRVSLIEYNHHQKGKTIVQRHSARLPRNYTRGSDVALYYHPDKPQRFELKNDSTTKISLIILGTLAALILFFGVYGINYLLHHTYRA